MKPIRGLIENSKPSIRIKTINNNMLNQNHHFKSEETQTNIFLKPNKSRGKTSTTKTKIHVNYEAP